MRRVRRWLLITVPLAGPLAIALWLSTGRAHPITKANFERINYGMTRAEVDALLGQKVVLVRGLDEDVLSSLRPGEQVVSRFTFGPVLSWVVYAEEDRTSRMPPNIIVVQFRDGKVVSKDFVPWTTSLINRLRYRLGL